MALRNDDVFANVFAFVGSGHYGTPLSQTSIRSAAMPTNANPCAMDATTDFIGLDADSFPYHRAFVRRVIRNLNSGAQSPPTPSSRLSAWPFQQDQTRV